MFTPSTPASLSKRIESRVFFASTPFGERDKGGLSRQAAYNLIEGAIRGIKRR